MERKDGKELRPQDDNVDRWLNIFLTTCLSVLCLVFVVALRSAQFLSSLYILMHRHVHSSV
jgi:hypothetical protein